VRKERFLVWRGLGAWRAEVARARIEDHRLAARGTQIGVDPEPYELRYELTTAERFVTNRLTLSATGEGWDRRLELVRGPEGSWSANGEPVAGVEGALDCDIANCPMTNTMPVLRDALLSGGEPRDYVMAWIAVPDLTVHRSEQRYEPLDDRLVRYVSRDSDFVSELEYDADGFVVTYPQMAERLSSPGP
jgi:uncharacterized protein